MPQVVKKQYVSRNGEWVEVAGGASDLGDHLAAADPHPQYATDADVAAEGAAGEAYFDSTPSWLYMQGVVQQIGAPDIMPYLHASVTLTPGFWIVEGAVGVFNQQVEDGCWGVLCDAGTTVAIPNSVGAQSNANTDVSTLREVRSSLVLIEVVSGTRVIHPGAYRNGGSALKTDAAPNGPLAWVSAIRIRM
jgi:hypothetical protein